MGQYTCTTDTLYPNVAHNTGVSRIAGTQFGIVDNLSFTIDIHISTYCVSDGNGGMIECNNNINRYELDSRLFPGEEITFTLSECSEDISATKEVMTSLAMRTIENVGENNNFIM